MKYYIKVLKNYANFDGRARRSEYWYFFLFHILVSAVLGFVAGIVNFPTLGYIYSFAIVVPSIAVGIRRMHDVGKNGWYCIVPFYNIVLACRAGDIGANEYGSDPKSNVEIEESA